jgi:uncharacterized membrane protein (DUF4010 family)
MPLVAGALVAGAVSCLRTAALAWALAPSMARLLLPALAAAAVVQFAASLLLLRQAPSAPEPSQEASNPFELGAVLKMALLLGIISVLARHGAANFGDAGAYAVAALSGLADVDAVTLSMAGLVPEALPARSAAIAVAVAVGVNMLAKMAYAAALGGRRFGSAFGLASMAAMAAGGLALSLPG